MIDSRADDVSSLEEALINLAIKNHDEPSNLIPADLDPLRQIVGDAALDYILIICAFHFVNRIADQLGVTSEMLPSSLRKFGFIRNLAVRMMAIVIGMMDLSNRQYGISYEQALDQIKETCLEIKGLNITDEFNGLQSCPRLLEYIGLMIEDQAASSLEEKTYSRIHSLVEESLPRGKEDVNGFHPRPDDPVDAFIFVGTRYANRATLEMVDALRQKGYDDLKILDLSIAVANANVWARFYRMMDLDPDLV